MEHRVSSQDSKIWIAQRADPYVYKHSDGTYYFTASVPAYDGIVLRKSKTLAGLIDADEVYIWKKHDSGEMSKHIWAPELHYFEGKWIIYFAASREDDIWALRPYILECEANDPMQGEWKEKGMIQSAEEDEFSFNAFSLDATVFENKGRYYYVWAEKVSVGAQISNLYIAEMKNPYQLKSAQILLSTPDYDWERVGFWVNEGPAIIKKNGHTILFSMVSTIALPHRMVILPTMEDADLVATYFLITHRYSVLPSLQQFRICHPCQSSLTIDSE